jgi:porphobilinogen synthase
LVRIKRPPAGIPAILLFGLPAGKDAVGSEAYARDGIVQQAIRAIKDSVSDVLIITDVCLCEYTSHGHCGVVERGRVKNDPTLELLAKVAVSHAEAGADMVAPSDMMDGRVAAIREALDESGLDETPILAYAPSTPEAMVPSARRRVGAPVRGPPRLPDGPGQRRRGAA